MRTKMALVSVLLSCLQPLNADSVIQKFETWNIVGGNRSDRLLFLVGWSNGFLYGKGADALPFLTCLETMSHEQMIAMIDKYYKEHPERWSQPVGEEILRALTVKGSPCAVSSR